MRRVLPFAILLWAATAHASGYGHLLAQANPAATTLTDIYTVAASASGAETSNAVITTIMVANRDGSPHSFRLSMASGGAVDDPKQYLYYGVAVPANSSLVQSVSLPLSAGDKIRAWADAQQLTF